MRPIDSSNQLDSTSSVGSPDLNPEKPTSSAPPPTTVDQPMEAPDPSAGASKRMERDLETAYFKGVLDNAGTQRGTQVLYDRNAKPDTVAANETAVPLSAPVNLGVRAEAGHLVGKNIVGRGECYDLADHVLREAGAKSAPDFQKITGKRDQDYMCVTPIAVKDA